jgi:hypothetical protein
MRIRCPTPLPLDDCDRPCRSLPHGQLTSVVYLDTSPNILRGVRCALNAHASIDLATVTRVLNG